MTILQHDNIKHDNITTCQNKTWQYCNITILQHENIRHENITTWQYYNITTWQHDVAYYVINLKFIISS